MTQNKIKTWDDCIKEANKLFKLGYIAVSMGAYFCGGDKATCDISYRINWYPTLPSLVFKSRSFLNWEYDDDSISFNRMDYYGIHLHTLHQEREEEHHFIKTLPAPWNSLTKIGEEKDNDTT